jgi:hypothetical protein
MFPLYSQSDYDFDSGANKIESVYSTIPENLMNTINSTTTGDRENYATKVETAILELSEELVMVQEHIYSYNVFLNKNDIGKDFNGEDLENSIYGALSSLRDLFDLVGNYMNADQIDRVKIANSIVSKTEDEVIVHLGNVLYFHRELKLKDSYSAFSLDPSKAYGLTEIDKEKKSELEALSELSTDMEKLEYNLSETDLFSQSLSGEIESCTGDCDEGYGVFNFHNTGKQYIGQWKNKKRNGQGKLFTNKRLVYEGDWESDEMIGDGIIYFEDGDKYVGKVYRGRPNGYGKLYRNGDLIYDGQWEKGKNID